MGLGHAVTDEPEVLYNLWYETAAHTRQAWGQVIVDDGLEATVARGDDYVVSLRRMLVESLLHTGHASVLRESVDGLVGNDPP